MSDFTISADWIENFKTERGAWTREQLDAVGIDWPPRQGWKYRIIGRKITNSNRLRFEARRGKNGKVRSCKSAPKLVADMLPRTLRRAARRAKKREKERLVAEQAAIVARSSSEKYKAESKEFFASDRWKELRYAALKNCGSRCLCCGASRADGAVLHVDHIKPRYHHPELQWDLSNLQVLCADCNYGKRAWDETDWRDPHMKAIANE